MAKINAPFTEEQVKNLNDWQDRTDVHPFTCGGQYCKEKGGVKLIATVDGWICGDSTCSYTQDWAYDYMAIAYPKQKTQEELIGVMEEFIGYPIAAVERKVGIHHLWPVIRQCREVAIANKEHGDIVKAWLSIATELWRVPEDLTTLIQTVGGFAEYYLQLKNATPASTEPQL